MNSRWFLGLLVILSVVFGMNASFLPSAAFASPEEAFATAIQAIKKNDLDTARQRLLELDKSNPKQLAVLNNLALIAVKKNQLGPAIALWRQAQYEYPTDETIDASIQWALKKLPKTELSKDYDLWESFRSSVLHKTSPMLTVVLSAVLMVLGGWMLLRWWARRRQALEQETAMPALPLAGFTVVLLFFFLSAMALSQFVDRIDIRGTVLRKKVEVRSAADSSATVLFEIFEGMEVLVLDSRVVGEATWRRIHYPGGMSGWVKDTDVMTTADATERAFQ